jgi:hypothetical protein
MLRVYALIVARQRLGKHAPTLTNTHAATEELLNGVSSKQSVLYKILNMQ